MPLILIVDDNPENLTVLGELLQPRHAVRVANSGVRALRLARLRPQPDLILLDVMMPGMDGHEVLRQLRAQPETARIPVVFLTALSDPLDAQRGLLHGVDGYLTKPISPERLLARVQAHLRAGVTAGAAPPAPGSDRNPPASAPPAAGPDAPLQRIWQRLCSLAALGSWPDDVGIALGLRADAAQDWIQQSARQALPFLQEHWDGSGFPDGLAGPGIPLLPRLWAVAQAYESALLLSPGVPANAQDFALQAVLAGQGRRFDPQAVNALLAALAQGQAAGVPTSAHA